VDNNTKLILNIQIWTNFHFKESYKIILESNTIPKKGEETNCERKVVAGVFFHNRWQQKINA